MAKFSKEFFTIHGFSNRFNLLSISRIVPAGKSDRDSVVCVLSVIFTNSKIEFMYDAIIQNVYKSTYFAWIDFNCHLKNKH